MRKFSKILSVLLVAVLAFGLVAVVASASGNNTSTASSTDGRTFTSSDEFSMTNPLKTQPMTYKALINVPTSATTRGVIFGNYREADISCVNFEITGAGKPSIFVIDSSKVETRITFDYDVRGLGWIDLAITHTITETGSEFTCYINGESIGTITAERALKISVASSQRQYRFALGHDWYAAGYYFKGSIQNVAVYNTALTADEISSAYSNGVNLSDTTLMAYYDLNKPENQSGWRITDSTSGEHDFEPLFQETRRDFDYAYSIAVVGDTQHLIYRDAHHNEDWTSPVYDWLVANKDSKNIKFVMGVGDITNRDGKDDVNDGVDNTNVEWDIAVAQLNKLYDAGIPYSLVVGNHDSVAQLDKFFADNPNFTNADIGYYSGTSLGNYYMKFTAGQTKYMVIGLDYGANDNKLAWAGEVIANNPDYKVIITTHAYMCADGTTLESTDSTSVPRPENPIQSEKDKNNGDDMWHELASKYENVILVFSGHISASDIVYRKDFGDNGNTVYQMLMDFQTMDTKYSRKTGMVAMFYFSEDGSVINVEYVSTYRSLEAQKKNPDALDIVFRPAVNSFTIEYTDEVGVGEETPYGTISPAYLDAELYPVVLFKSDKTFIGGFYELNHAAQSLVSVYNDKGGSYVMYFRADSVNAGDVVSLGSFTGELLIDLNGTTVRNTPNYMMNFTFSGSAGNSPSVTIKNGTFIKDKNTLGLIKVDYSASASLSQNAHLNITFENVTFRSLVNYNNNTSVTFVTYEGGYDSATAEVRVNAVFNDCTFDYVNSISGAVMIPMKHYYKNNANDRVVFDVTVNGGEAIYTSASAFTSYFYLSNNNTNGRADSIKFGRNADGNYINLVLPAGSAAPTTSYNGTSGEKCTFNEVSTDESNSTYTLINADALQTKYGTLGAAYENPELYPVVVFQKTSSGYKFIGGYSTFDEAAGGSASKDANASGLRLVSGWYKNEFVILLRADAVSKNYGNYNSAYGTYTVDLNGYTLTSKSYLIRSNHDVSGKNPTTISKYFTLNFINGTIKSTGGYALFLINYGTSNTRSHSLSFNFDNVTFETTNSNYAIFTNWEDGGASTSADLKVLVNVEFNDCTFNFVGTSSDLNMIFMKSTKGYDKVIYDVTINGGTILLDRAFDKAHFLAMNDNTNGRADKVTFGKNANGEYITLVMPSTIAAPSASEIYTNTSGVDCIFAKASEVDGKIIYRIRPVETVGIDFTPKMSISLDRNLIMNVYVPKNLLVKFTFDGVEYANFEEVGLELVMVDGKEYYLFKVSLPSEEAARDIKLIATVTLGEEKTATATFTFSVIRYSEKILSTVGEAEKQLLKDVLSYIRAAYVYFGSEDAAAIAKIDALLGEDYDKNNAPALEGDANSTGEGLKAATFVLDGEPSMRFYLPDGADASKYAFYIDGKKVATQSGTDSTGAYVDIDVYAYALCETVTYTIDGEEIGSYHIGAYCNYVKTVYTGADKAKLISVTERFWKYLQSAREYRNSVLNSEVSANAQGN